MYNLASFELPDELAGLYAPSMTVTSMPRGAALINGGKPETGEPSRHNRHVNRAGSSGRRVVCETVRRCVIHAG